MSRQNKSVKAPKVEPPQKKINLEPRVRILFNKDYEEFKAGMKETCSAETAKFFVDEEGVAEIINTKA